MKDVRGFDEKLLKMLIENVTVLNRVQVEFMMRAQVRVVEVI